MDRPLTARQEAFVRGVVAGKTYKQAFIDAGYAWKESWGARAAHRLRHTPRVARRLAALRAEAADTGAHLEMLAQMRDAAMAAGRVSAAIQAEGMRAKALGIYGRGGAARAAGTAGAAGAAGAGAPSPSPFDQMSEADLVAEIREMVRHPAIRELLEQIYRPGEPAAAAPVPSVCEAAGVPRGRGGAS